MLKERLELRDHNRNEENDDQHRHDNENGGIDERGNQVGTKLLKSREMF